MNAIWEGSGNVIALDALRATAREPECLEACMAFIARAMGVNVHYDAHAKSLSQWLEPGAMNEGAARAFAEDMGLALSAAALFEATPDYVFDGYCAARLDPGHRAFGFGATGALIDEPALIARAAPF